MNESSGKTALITGASSGIGLEIAKLFAKDGYNLILVARSDDKLQQLADEFQQSFGIQTTVIGKDLSQDNAAQEVYDQVREKGLTVNILVNDAGVGLHGKFATETDWEREKSIIFLNVVAVTQLTKLFLKDMVERNEGKILNLASLVSITPFPLMAVYAATKAYVYNFTQSLVNELKDSAVTITALLPNATDTDFFNKAGASNVRATDQVDDPAMVARDGYNALMSGAHKVIPGGLMNKMYEVMSYLAPQEALAALMRYNNTPKDQSTMENAENKEVETNEKSDNSTLWAWGIGLAAFAVAGLAVTIAYNNASEYDKMRYRNKLGKWKSKANDSFDKASGATSHLSDAITSGWENLKQTVSHSMN